MVDDEKDVLDLICSVLEDEGYDVLCLSHPVLTDDLQGEASHPRLFVLDIMLPAMSGIELARRLRKNGFEDTPMIAMSASPDMLDVAAQSDLFHALIPKPFELDTLLHTVQEHVPGSHG